MGVLEPYEVRFLKFGNTLDDIPTPKDFELPPIESVPPQPEDDPPDGGEEDDKNDELDKKIEAMSKDEISKRIQELEEKRLSNPAARK